MNISFSKFLENSMILLILAFPVALIVGPLFVNMITSIIAIYTLILFPFSKSVKKIFFHKISIFIIIFSIYLIINSLISTNPLFSLGSSLFYVRYLLFAIGLAYFLGKKSKLINWFGYSLWICFIVLVIDGYFQYIFGYNIFGWEKYDPIRISSFFREELILGSYLSRLLPLCFFLILFLNKDNIKKNIFIFFCFLLIVIDILIYLTGERTAFLFLLLITLGIILTVPYFRLLRIITFGISLLAIFVISISNNSIKERMIDFTLEQSGVIDGKNFESEYFNKFVAFSPAHQLHYDSAYLIFLDSPLFGQGPKMFRELCREEKYDIFFINPSKSCDVTGCACSTHPHHTYMQLLAETGLIGAIPVLIIFLIISYQLFQQFIYVSFKKKNYMDPRLALLLISFFITLWPIAPSGNFFGSWLNSVYYLPLGFYLFFSTDPRFLLYPKKTSTKSEEKKNPMKANK